VLPEGRLASGSDDGTVRVWDLSAGTARVLEGRFGSDFPREWCTVGCAIVQR
jgi:hypothetical protein